MIDFIRHMFTPECGTTLALGMAGHFVFDLFGYAAVGALGFKLGHHCKHRRRSEA